ncbi:MMPL family transporter [Paenibacillus sp. P26]|nr:MMPL family transporter [Paenibacillus sp. P26]
MQIIEEKHRSNRGSMLRSAGRLIVRCRWLVIILGILVMLGAGFIGAGTVGKLSLSRWEVPGSESYTAGKLLEQRFGAGAPNLVLLVTAKEGTVDSPEVRQAGLSLMHQLVAEAAVQKADSYWARGDTPTLRSSDGKQALILAHLKGTVTEARTALAELSPRYQSESGLIKVEVGGQDEIFRQAAEYARKDFVRAELIILPAVFLMLLLVYRRVRASLLTIGVGFFAMVGTLTGLRGVAELTEVSTFALNLTLVMGLGLGIDYSLFMIARFREELAAGKTALDSAVRAVETAGRTVIFSGVTVAASTAVLFVFPFPFLQSFAYTGVLVVMTSIIGAVVILPAVLAVLGEKIMPRGRKFPAAALGRDVLRSGLWYRSAMAVMRRPAMYGGLALAVLLVLGSPVTNLRFGLPDDRTLPAGASSRIVEEQKRAGFAAEETDAIRIAALSLRNPESKLQDIAQYAADVSKVPGIAQVDSLAGSYAEGRRTSEPASAHSRFSAGGEGTWLSAVPYAKALEDDAPKLVNEVRAVSAPFDVLVGGYPADMTDFRSALAEPDPLAAVLILAISFGILFLMTGSILLPLKATVLNVLSLTIMFGSLVWIFQQGHLSGLLQFTSSGSTEPSIPILMFCIAYGLSMDYEVFILSRIKEEYDRTGDLTEAVAAGIQRSGPLVTAAAAILAFTFAAYGTGSIVFLKMLGVGMTLAVLVDATLVRGVLVPAFMKLAGRANWWAPAPLRRFHERYGISEAEAPEPAGGREGSGTNALVQ